MPPPIITSKEIILTYRHLYQHLLRAVQYSQPSRYTARDRLRAAFQTRSPESYDPERIARTLEFLQGAAKTKGLEHVILKNLMHVWWERGRLEGMIVRTEDLAYQKRTHVDFDQTVERLNESMGMCL